MKKTLLLTGILAAAILSISACGGKKADTTTAAVTEATSEAAKETTKETTEQTATSGTAETSSEAAASTVPIEGELPTSVSKEQDPNVDPVEVVMNKEDVKAYAEEIQKAVAAKDLVGLMDLCAFPVYVTLEGQEGQEIDDSDVFAALDAGKLFSDSLVKAIAAVDTSKLTSSKAGVVMGEKVNIIFSDVEGNLAITGINQ